MARRPKTVILETGITLKEAHDRICDIIAREGILKDVMGWIAHFKENPHKISIVRFAQHVKAALTGKNLLNRNDSIRIGKICDEINAMLFRPRARYNPIDKEGLIGTQVNGFTVIGIKRDETRIYEREKVVLKCNVCGNVAERNLRRFLYSGHTGLCEECRHRATNEFFKA